MEMDSRYPMPAFNLHIRFGIDITIRMKPIRNMTKRRRNFGVILQSTAHATEIFELLENLV